MGSGEGHSLPHPNLTQEAKGSEPPVERGRAKPPVPPQKLYLAESVLTKPKKAPGSNTANCDKTLRFKTIFEFFK